MLKYPIGSFSPGEVEGLSGTGLREMGHLARGRGRRTAQERTANLVGVLLWVAWVVLVIVASSVLITDEGTAETVRSPFFQWLTFGPLLVFMFLGRRLMRFETKMASGSLSNMSNAVTSATAFMAWGLVILVWDCFFGGADVPIGVALGILFTYLVLVATNRRFNI